MNVAPRHLLMISDAEAPCGVETLVRLTAEKLAPRAATAPLGFNLGSIRRSLQEADAVIFNFPVVAWKKKLVEPVAVALLARSMGKQVIVVVHEWDELDWRRRAVLSPACLLATAILFPAPEIAAQFAASPVSKLATGKRGFLSIPPNLVAPALLKQTALSATLRRQRQAGRLILGQFGSIYPKKQPTRVLDVASALLKAGHDVGVAFIGSFVKAQDDVEGDFYRRVDALGLRDRVLVSGYVGETDELFGIIDEVDVFCYVFPGGLTVRRGSVLAVGLSGKPMVINGPPHRDIFDHHPLFSALIANGAIRLVSTEADADELASAVIESFASAHGPRLAVDAEIAELWAGIVAQIDKAAGDGGPRKERLGATATT